MKVIRVVIFIAILLIIISILSIPIIYYNQQPKKGSNVFLQNAGKKSLCGSTRVVCNNDTDCDSKCVQDMEYKCQSITTADNLKNDKKYCLPVDTSVNCRKNNGGLSVWTGWGDTNRMEWDCMCLFPDYFGGDGCTQTPGVCELGKKSFMKERDYSQGDAPSSKDCIIPEELKNMGYALYEREDGTPVILEEGKSNYYKYKKI